MDILADHINLVVQGRLAVGFSRSKTRSADLQPREAAARKRGTLLLVCECGRDDCVETIELTRLEYEAVRSHPRLYVVAPGHGTPGVTGPVTDVAGRFDVVELLRYRSEVPTTKGIEQ
jgi:hypothetical protein